MKLTFVKNISPLTYSGCVGFGFAHDASSLVMSDWSGGVALYPQEESSLIIIRRTGPIAKAAVSFDGNYLAAASGGMVSIINIPNALNIERVLSHPSNVTQLAFGPSGDVLAVGLSNRQVYLWRLASGELVSIWRPPSFAHGDIIESVALNWDNSLLAVSFRSSGIYLCNPNDSSSLHLSWTKPENEPVKSLAFDRQGLLILLSSSGVSGVTVDASEKTDQQFSNHIQEGLCLSLFPDGYHFAVGLGKGFVQIWKTDGNLLAERQICKDHDIRQIAISRDGLYLACMTFISSYEIYRIDWDE